jgi:integration host factor subunit alpha
MTKTEIADRVYQKIGFSRNVAITIVNEVFDIIKETVKKGEPVKISGFGTFIVRKRKGRIGHNPKTGEKVKIEPLKILKLRPSITLKKKIARIAK